jgi:hypothetical protein
MGFISATFAEINGLYFGYVYRDKWALFWLCLQRKIGFILATSTVYRDKLALFWLWLHYRDKWALCWLCLQR